ncbi:MAG: PAS domain-containing protein [Balneola sp.]
MSITDRLSVKSISIIAVSTLIVLIVSNQLLIQKILVEKRDDATVINLAGRQRMLSQKIAKTVYLAENKDIQLEALRKDVEVWSVTHEGLKNGNQELGIEASQDDLIQTLLSETEPHYEAIRTSLSDFSSKEEIITAIPVIRNHEEQFLEKMDEIVKTFEAISNESVRTLIRLEVILGLFSLFVIGGEIYLIFRIFIARIQNKNEELERSVQELSESKGDLFEYVQRFDLSLKAINAGLWDWYLEDNSEWWSPRFYELLGYEDGEIEPSYNTFLNILLHRDDKEKVVDAVEQHLKSGALYKLEIRMKNKSGEYRWFETVGQASFDADGNPVRMVGSIIDIDERKQIEHDLEASNEKIQRGMALLSETQQAAKIGSWEVDLGTMIAFWSDEVYRIHEVEKGTPIKVEEGINFYREDFRPVIQNAINNAIENRSSWDEECILLTKTGKEIWVRAIGHPVFEDGQLTGLRGLFMDIDETKRKTLELDETYEKLQLSVEAGQIAIWIWDMKTNELDWNDQAYDVFGVTKDFEPTFEKFSSMIHPDDLNYVVESSQKSIETGDKFDIQFRFNKGNGDEIILSGRGDIVRDEEGNPIQMIGINMDITDRNEMVENLKRQESQLRSFVEQAPAAVAMFDKDMKYITVSNKWYEHNRIEGQSIIGKSHYDVLPQVKKRKDWLKIHKRVLAGEELSKGKDQFTRIDNSEVWISWTAIPWHNADGEIGGMILYVSDITKEVEYTEELENEIEARTQQIRKQAENLEQVNKELESFSYSISHDLRAPLRSINGFSDILMEDYAEQLDEEGKRLMGIVKESAVTMGQLIDDILEFSRLGKKKIQKSEIDMTKLFESVCEVETGSYSDKQIDLKIDDLPNARGDVALIKQVVVNLVSNAFKYSSKEDKIVINIGLDQSEENEVAYFIKDNGTGFKMEYHDKLFGVFNRLHSKNEFEGTGVGLAIVKRIINKHGGKIWAESEEGKGSIFFFSLPNS